MNTHANNHATLVSVLLCSAIIAAACTSRGKSPPPQTDTGRVRAAVHAGSWYPGEPEVLRQELVTRLDQHAAAKSGEPIIGLIGPHAGLRFSGAVAAAAYAPLRPQKVKRIFLLGPSHSGYFEGVALPAPDLRAYATPLGELAIDQRAVAALRGQPGFTGPEHAHDREHSLEMHAIFIAAAQPDALLVPLVVGNLGSAKEIRALAKRLAPLLQPQDVVIASSDFTHYGPNFSYVPFRDRVPEQLDELMTRALAPITTGDLDRFDAYRSATQDTICGREPIRLLLALLPATSPARVVARDTSGHMTGDFRNSVSYASVLFRRAGGWPGTATGEADGSGENGATSEGGNTAEHLEQGPQVLNSAEQQLALEMARKTLEIYLGEKRVPDDDELGVPAAGPFRAEYGTFVTLERDGDLRGCIGHIIAVEPLWRDIRDNAIAAAVHDPRFRPVEGPELPLLEIEVSVLTHPEAVAGPDDVVVGRHGIVLKARGRQATFLPQVAPEQGWGRATTLTRLARKAGLPGDIWQTPEVSLSVYEAQVFNERSRLGTETHR